MSIADGNWTLLSQLTGKGNDRIQKANCYHTSIVHMFNDYEILGLGVSVRKGAVLGYNENPDNTIVNRIQFRYNAQTLYSERIEKEENVGVFSVSSSSSQSYFEPSSNLFSNQFKRRF